MKTQLILTTISAKKSHIELAKAAQDGFRTIPAEIDFNFEIEVKGNGDFSDYLNEDKSFNNRKLIIDIMEGKIDIVGREKIG